LTSLGDVPIQKIISYSQEKQLSTNLINLLELFRKNHEVNPMKDREESLMTLFDMKDHVLLDVMKDHYAANKTISPLLVNQLVMSFKRRI
jgi:hypothetical protein